MFIQPRIFPFNFFLNCWQKWRPKNWQRVKDLRFCQKRHLWQWWHLWENLGFLRFILPFGRGFVSVISPGSYHEPTGDPIDRLKEDEMFWKTRFFHGHLKGLKRGFVYICIVYYIVMKGAHTWCFFCRHLGMTWMGCGSCKSVSWWVRGCCFDLDDCCLDAKCNKMIKVLKVGEMDKHPTHIDEIFAKYVLLRSFIHCTFWSPESHTHKQPPLFGKERNSLWMETCFFSNPPCLWERGRGSLKNEVLSNNMSVVWTFETVGAALQFLLWLALLTLV